MNFIWDKVFKSRLGKFCRRHPLKNLLSPLCTQRVVPYFSSLGVTFGDKKSRFLSAYRYTRS